MTARAVALAALNEWRRGRQFAENILARLLAQHSLGNSDRAFTRELCYGVLRNLTLLDFWIEQLRRGRLDHASRDLLRLGLYQIFFLETPEHAAVFETVELSGRRSRGLINGIMRSALRQRDQLRAAAENAPASVRFSHPEFLIVRWMKNFGEEAALALCAWNNQPAPIYARARDSREFMRVNELPTDAIARGEVYIQDPSTALACELLAPQPNELILDACAAPGGKTAFLALMMQETGRIVACDRDPARLKRLRENLDRLGVANAEVVQVDWLASPALATQGFDRILVDAPCSNTGVMRRRIDVRWRLAPDDLVGLPNEQLAIVRAVLPFLKPGGTLVYSTCSIEPEENEQVVQLLLREFPFLRLEREQSSLPFRDHFDGAFAARLARVI
ncbi:MAG: methyltransferase domain-containing protein [Verrucomicrobiota bacterium]|nr:methyltransferase domain-containing protein [Verrucomicrobiota bacterium]